MADARVQPDRARPSGLGSNLSGRYDQLYTYVIYGMVLSYTLTVIALFGCAGSGRTFRDPIDVLDIRGSRPSTF